MSKINDGGPAFASPANQYEDGSKGMSLRDWFAGQALHAVLTHLWNAEGRRYENVYEIASLASYEAADAMIAARTNVSTKENEA
jgi:hypothetical protein